MICKIQTLGIPITKFVNNNLGILKKLLRQQTLAEDKVSVGEISEGLEEDLDHHAEVVVGRVKLVELEQRQVGLQVISLLPGLEVHIVL